MISFECEPGSAPKQAEQAESSSDDFASMLASVWCAPVASQTPAPEVASETTSDPTAVEGATDQFVGDQPLIPFTTTSNSDLQIPQPILTYDSATLTETPISETSAKKIALPDISLPVPKEKSDEDSKEPMPVVAEEVPVALTAPVSQPPVVVNDVAVSKGFVRPPSDPATDPIEPKVNVPVRNPPTLVNPKSVSNTAEIKEQDLPPVEVVTSDANSSMPEPVNAVSNAPDQVTAEAIKREANLAASYLAQSTRDGRENAFEAIKVQVSSNGPDSQANDAGPEKKFADNSPGAANISAGVGSLTFGSTLKTNSIETLKELISPQVANQIIELTAATQPRQQRSVRLRLRPEELGQVEVQLSRDAAGKVSAHVLVERENARAALSQSLPQLREALERAGLSVDRLNVTSDANSFGGETRDNQQPEASQRSAFMNGIQQNTSETQSKERVREHKLLSLSA